MSKIEFGTPEAITSKTPNWANYIFRTVIILTTVATAYIAGTQLIQEAVKFEIMLALKAIDMTVWGIGRLFGVVEEKQ